METLVGSVFHQIESRVQQPALNGEQVPRDLKKTVKNEIFHKSLKSNATLAKSPTRAVIIQSNHASMSIYALFKL